jgi:hypothetical protein
MRNIFTLLFVLFLIGCTQKHLVGVPVVGPQGPQGEAGQPGLDGKDGSDGADGVGCSVQNVSNGALITCGTTTAVVLNGIDGEDAPPTTYSVVNIINPCGDSSGFDEVLLKLANGSLMAHYSHGNKQFLTLLTPGNYATTDGESCNFTVHSDMSVTW